MTEKSHEDTAAKAAPHKAISAAAISALSKTDETILRFNRLLSTKYGLDLTLSALNHGSHALHHLLASSPLSKLRLVIRLWLLRRLGRNVSVVSQTAIPSTAQPPLLAFSTLISKTRFTIRLLGLASIWSMGSSAYKSPPNDSVLRIISYIEVVSLFIYQALENVTYLATNGVTGLALINRTGGLKKWTLLSIRAWFTYVLVQFVKLARESTLYNQREEERKKRQAEEVLAGEKTSSQVRLEDDADAEATRQAEIRNWRKRLVNNAAWAPLCAHWSFENGIGVPSSMTGFISLLAGVWATYDAWQATALR